MNGIAEFIVWSYLLLVNLAALIMFGVDKRRARQGSYRIPERRLLLAAVLGGGAGAWMGMYLFRHKTRHLKFVVGVPVIVILYAGMFIYWKIIL